MIVFPRNGNTAISDYLVSTEGHPNDNMTTIKTILDNILLKNLFNV